MQIPARFSRLLTTFLMSIYMVIVMTFVITLVNTGLDSGFLMRWGRAFVIAWPLAFTLILVGGPRIQRASAKLIEAT